MKALVLLLLATTASADPGDTILRAAKDYQAWGRIDQELELAPTDCSAPVPPPPDQVALSKAKSGEHENKLDFLWASNRDAYFAGTTFDVGFAIVKQSFSSQKVAQAHRDTPRTTLETADGIFAIDQPKDLFIMAKVGSGAAAWIYGTVASCMPMRRSTSGCSG